MKYKIIGILIASLFFASCGGSKSIAYQKQKNSIRVKSGSEKNIREDLVKSSYKYEGVKYKAAGTTSAGMDCSGLMVTVFNENGLELPRSSSEQATVGDEVDLKKVEIGDLLFFNNNPKRNVINHVGMVVDVKDDEVFFIHTSSSRGVMISSMNEPYNKRTYITARNVLK